MYIEITDKNTKNTQKNDHQKSQVYDGGKRGFFPSC